MTRSDYNELLHIQRVDKAVKGLLDAGAPARILRCLRCDAHWWYSADDIAAQEAIDATS